MAHLDWLRQSVVPATAGADLGLHLMRLALMEEQLGRKASAPWRCLAR